MPLFAKELRMTTAPDNLKAARTLLLQHLPIDPASVGIVGDANHWGGYHCGADRVVSGDYSVVESSRDKTGLAEWACALDVGTFSVTAGGRTHNLRTFSVWLAGQCAADAAATRDIREVIYSPDGSTVKRWDRLGKRSSGDSSHLWHTHISYHRDAVKAGRDQSALFRRYLTEIGILEDDMPLTAEDISKVAAAAASAVHGQRIGARTYTFGQVAERTWNYYDRFAEQKLRDEAILAAVKDDADRDAILARVDQRAAELRVGLAQDILAALPAGTDPVTREELEGALRTVLGSLNDTTQA